MKEYKIQIEEMLSKIVSVEADSEEEAYSIAKEKYRKAEDGYVLTAYDFAGVTIECVKEV